MLRNVRITRVALGFAGGLYAYDVATYQRVNRSVRAVSAAAATLVDYKLLLDYDWYSLEEMHTRVSTRWYNVCKANGGLYVKLGQSIASMNHVLPPQYSEVFAKLQDRAPAVPFADVEAVVREDFGGRGPDELFASFERAPVASASIAQVHRAVTHAGEEVAVKVQKPYIRHQMPWDLACYHLLVYAFEKLFDLPMYWTVPSTADALRSEADFVNEARNSERAAKELNAWLAGRRRGALLGGLFGALGGGGRDGANPHAAGSSGSGVRCDPTAEAYIPPVHWDRTTGRVLTVEWVGGACKLSDAAGMRARGLSPSKAMRTATELFAHQLFVGGFVHCDPHPGNVLVRQRPVASAGGTGGTGSAGDLQVVVIDHGLYRELAPSFRLDYCALWKAMVLMDVPRVRRVCARWGIVDADLFASFQLLKPWTPGGAASHSVVAHNTTRAQVLALQLAAKKRVRAMLRDTSRTPRELVLVGRHLNLVRATNKHLGSPVNRVDILARYAADGAVVGGDERGGIAVGSGNASGNASGGRGAAPLPPPPRWPVARRLLAWARGVADVVAFRSRLLALSGFYHAVQLWRAASRVLFGRAALGFEERLERNMADGIEARLGYRVRLEEGGKCFG